MTIAIDDRRSVEPPQRMTLAAYLEYDDGTDTRYELENGVLVEMGSENPLNLAIAMSLAIEFAKMGVPAHWLLIGLLVEVSSRQVTARIPDLVVHSKASAAAVYSGVKLLGVDMPAPLLVVEVASNSLEDKASYQRDYVSKRAEYAERGIPEYWIVDPMAKVVLVLTRVGAEYQEQRFTGPQGITSPSFPALDLTAEQVLNPLTDDQYPQE